MNIVNLKHIKRIALFWPYKMLAYKYKKYKETNQRTNTVNEDNDKRLRSYQTTFL